MKEAINVIRKIAAITDKAVLFHSATGKDSIALLHLMHPFFKEILCVFMYAVRDLEHVNKYIGWAQRRYPQRAVYPDSAHGGVFRGEDGLSRLQAEPQPETLLAVRPYRHRAREV